MSTNVHLKNAEIARGVIQDLLPVKGPIELDELNYCVQQLVNSSKSVQSGVPLSMTSIFANYTLSNFISQFHLRFDLNGSLIPVNMIGFLLSSSGKGKDSTIGAQERAMERGYNAIESFRKEKEIDRAKRMAEEKDGDASMWKQYYKNPMPLANSISTVEGITYRLNQFKRDGVGMPSLFISELGSELQTNPDITGNIRLLSELYDAGNKKSKAIKDTERQDQEVHGMGMCSLFVGSEDNIVMDRTISAKFKTEFVTKLARRTHFVYPSREEFNGAIVDYKDFDDMQTKTKQYKIISDEARASIGHTVEDVADFWLSSEKRILNISEEAMRIYEAYKIYCDSLGSGLDYVHKSSMLEQTHRHWKTLKMAGVYAALRKSQMIEPEDLRESIYYSEKVGYYLTEYENYASKENYELMFDFLENNPTVSLSLHELKKRGFIPGTSNFENKAKELAEMANSYAGAKGTVIYDSVIYYKPFEESGDHGVSFMEVTGSKQERAIKCHSGYIYKQVAFDKLTKLITNDTAYSPFKFEDGKRSNNNIISGASWVALDVDNTETSIYEMHDILGDYNHHICTTSDKENVYKYRILLEFNKIVDLQPTEWKSFGKELCKELGIDIDMATFTKSQIMFGYKDSLVYSLTTAEKYDVSNCIKLAIARVQDVQPSITQSRKLLDNPLETFRYAFDAKDGEGSLMLYRAFKHAHDLGAKQDEVIKLIVDINGYWENPLDDERLEKTILVQVRRQYDADYGKIRSHYN